MSYRAAEELMTANAALWAGVTKRVCIITSAAWHNLGNYLN